MPLYDFQCPTCNKVTEDIILSLSELENPETVHELHCYCTKQGTVMTQAYIQAPAIVTMTKSRIATDMSAKRKLKKDRSSRAKKHFVNEVLPTINKKDRKYFAKKYNAKV